jgi:hypothetical protein
MVREHLGPTPRGDLSSTAGMILMKVGEHDTPQVPGLRANAQDGIGDCRTGPRSPRVDQREPVSVTPQIRLPDLETEQMQFRQQLNDLHMHNLGTVEAVQSPLRLQQITESALDDSSSVAQSRQPGPARTGTRGQPKPELHPSSPRTEASSDRKSGATSER